MGFDGVKSRHLKSVSCPDAAAISSGTTFALRMLSTAAVLSAWIHRPATFAWGSSARF